MLQFPVTGVQVVNHGETAKPDNVDEKFHTDLATEMKPLNSSKVT